MVSVVSDPSSRTTSCGAKAAICTSMDIIMAFARACVDSLCAVLSTRTKWCGLGHIGSFSALATSPSTATAAVATRSVATRLSTQYEPSTPAAVGNCGVPMMSDSCLQPAFRIALQLVA